MDKRFLFNKPGDGSVAENRFIREIYMKELTLKHPLIIIFVVGISSFCFRTAWAEESLFVHIEPVGNGYNKISNTLIDGDSGGATAVPQAVLTNPQGEGERDEEKRSDTGKGILWSAERGENTAN